MEKKMDISTSDERFCFDILFHTSRSFSTLIYEFEEPLRTTICVFYLILRGLDTIEDDTTIENSMKVVALKNFPTFLDHLKTNFPIGVGHGLKFNSHNTNKYHVELIHKFDIILRVFDQCTTQSQKIIRDTTDEMAKGMIKFSSHPIDTMADYNEYCYYVAGVAGIGLTKLFESNFISHNVYSKDIEKLAISTGTFLQKTNIIRDVYEDMTQSKERIFYPKEVWGKYVNNACDLIDEKYLPQAIACINFLIIDAFQHLPHSIEYISLLSQKSVFRFCAIPQVIAVGTLEKMFNNAAVLNSNVKLARTDIAYVLEKVTDVTSFLTIIKSYLSNLSTKVLATNSFDDTKNWVLDSFKFVNEFEESSLKSMSNLKY